MLTVMAERPIDHMQVRYAKACRLAAGARTPRRVRIYPDLDAGLAGAEIGRPRFEPWCANDLAVIAAMEGRLRRGTHGVASGT